MPENRIRSFLKGLATKRGTIRAHAMIIGSQTCTVTDGACHSMFQMVPNPRFLGSGFVPTKEQMPIAEKFWKWVSNPETSPWKKLVVNGIEQVLGDDGLPVGWILPEETVKSTPFELQKNFCILTRVFTEKHEAFKTWYNLIKRDVDPYDAFYIASAIRSQHPRPGYVDNGNMNLAGGHWPITDGIVILKDRPPFDFNTFRTGEISFEKPIVEVPVEHRQKYSQSLQTGRYYYENINHFFQVKDKFTLREPFVLSTYCSPKTSGGSFSTITYYELDDIVNGFYSWQDKQGIRSV